MADTSQLDIKTFIALSVTLTQVSQSEIAPFADKINLKQQYLDKLVQEMGADKVNALFQRYNDLKNTQKLSDDAICEALINPADPSGNAGDFSFMARNILKMWYLGAWFPRTMKSAANVVATERGAPSTPVMSPGKKASSAEDSSQAYQVISSDAYVRGFAWRAMQAHPMGYSDFTFGYWAEQPPTLSEFLPLDTPQG